ncbi:MAG: hypothetical protein WBP94_14975 [Rhodomicrobiaceae bacterium]
MSAAAQFAQSQSLITEYQPPTDQFGKDVDAGQPPAPFQPARYLIEAVVFAAEENQLRVVATEDEPRQIGDTGVDENQRRVLWANFRYPGLKNLRITEKVAIQGWHCLPIA